jgi:hypothetical protein
MVYSIARVIAVHNRTGQRVASLLEYKVQGKSLKPFQVALHSLHKPIKPNLVATKLAQKLFNNF